MAGKCAPSRATVRIGQSVDSAYTALAPDRFKISGKTNELATLWDEWKSRGQTAIRVMMNHHGAE
jgi:hypothetical protein